MTTEQSAAPGTDWDAERRRRILDVAGDLFARKGYDTTGVGDVATAAQLGPATIYRLVGTKQELLTEIVLTSLTDAVHGVGLIELSAEDGLDALAALALQHRNVGVLWQRDIRQIAPEVQRQARNLIRQFAARIRVQLQIRRPELGEVAQGVLSWATVATLISPSLHHVDVSVEDYRRRIAAILGRILTTAVSGDEVPLSPWWAGAIPSSKAASPAGDERAANSGHVLPALRREALLVAAVHLFAERGYANVALDDIGAMAGVSGPSIYHHFPAKGRMLSTAAARLGAALQITVTTAYVGATDAAGALRALLAEYLRFALTNHELLSVLITDSFHLSADEQKLAAAAEREYVGEWVHLLRQLRGAALQDRHDPEVLVDVYAVIDIVNNVARIPRLRTEPASTGVLWAVCSWILHLD